MSLQLAAYPKLSGRLGFNVVHAHNLAQLSQLDLPVSPFPSGLALCGRGAKVAEEMAKRSYTLHEGEQPPTQ
jgi:hypothetical protein